jgi:hypothetical protein
MYDIYDKSASVVWGSSEWQRRVLAEWDDTLARLTRLGAKVVVVMPLWYEQLEHVPADAPKPNIERLRALYTQWAARHRNQVRIADVAPLACPAGPPCGPVNGIDFRPDHVHFDDPGGTRVAAYLRSHVPSLARLAAAGRHLLGSVGR